MASIPEWREAVARKLRQLTTIDSDTVKWEQTDQGMRAHVELPDVIDPIIEEISANAEYVYDGPFAITDNGDDTLNISAGKVINGTTVSSISAATNESVSGKTYLSIEIWYNSQWKTDYLAGSSYPTQGVKNDGGTDFLCHRRLIAEKVDGVWKQRFMDSEIINPRVV